MDAGGREGVPPVAGAPLGVGPAWSIVPSGATMSHHAYFPPEVSDMSGLDVGGDGVPPPLPRDEPAERLLETADDWLPWIVDPSYHAAGGGPNPSAAATPTHLPSAVAASVAGVVGGGGGGRYGGRSLLPLAALAASSAMPIDGDAAADAAMAAAEAALADAAAPAVEPLTAPSTPRSVNRGAGASSSRSMELGVAALTIGKRHAGTAAASAARGRPRPAVARSPVHRRGGDSVDSGSEENSSTHSGGGVSGGGGGDGNSSCGTTEGYWDEGKGKGNRLVAHLAAALAEVPPTTSAAATRTRALACLAAVRASAPDRGVGLPPVPTAAEHEALRIVLNRRSADRSRQWRRRQTTAVVEAVADKEATISALQGEVARLIAHVSALQRQLKARQQGHFAEAA